MAEEEALEAKFAALGLDDQKCRETAKNRKLSRAIVEVMQEAGFQGPNRSMGLLLYSLAALATSPDVLKQRAFIARKIASGALSCDAQVQAAVRYVDKRVLGDSINERDFDMECGVGVVVPPSVIADHVVSAIEKHEDALLRERYAFNTGLLLKALRDVPELRWADRKLVKDTLDAQLAVTLGPKTEADGKKPLVATLSSPAPTPSSPTTSPPSSSSSSSARVFEGDVLRLHRPGENKQLNEEIMRRHLEATGGKVVTRFPPEPNGFLHIGHAKAMNFSFRYAEAHQGICYLRYDDTNPEAERQTYYEAIRDAVAWLGFQPHQVTAASDYFAQLHAFAVELIRRSKAYVCHMTPEEIHASRGGDSQGPRHDSPWRDRPVDASLREFERMRNGEYEEGKATLRLKQDMQSGNPCMWDLVAYRVMYTPHCRTGRQWCIYPMYDFTHCLCDSLENITHSLCTTEFINAREAYYWVCDSLEVYKAVQWEYGRLNITNTVLSKRKLTKLVEEGVVRGWDDPRLYTLAGIRRRGFPPSAVNRFVEDLGITTAASVVDVRKLEAVVRDDLNRTTPRRMAVLDPLAVVITNLPADHGVEEIELPNDPRDAAKGTSKVPFTSRLYIDRSDFRLSMADDRAYKRFAPEQPVGLFKVGTLTYGRHEEADGKIVCVYARLERSAGEDSSKASSNKSTPLARTYIQWVADCAERGSPLRAEVRIYGDLFRSRNPDAAPGGFLQDIHPHSLTVVPEALVDVRLGDAQVEDKFQFQRVGYFCKDPDSTPTLPVFNLTVGIKEDPNKT
jgi:glutaminyl-tRNA synthetase